MNIAKFSMTGGVLFAFIIFIIANAFLFHVDISLSCVIASHCLATDNEKCFLSTFFSEKKICDNNIMNRFTQRSTSVQNVVDSRWGERIQP